MVEQARGKIRSIINKIKKEVDIDTLLEVEDIALDLIEAITAKKANLLEYKIKRDKLIRDKQIKGGNNG